MPQLAQRRRSSRIQPRFLLALVCKDASPIAVLCDDYSGTARRIATGKKTCRTCRNRRLVSYRPLARNLRDAQASDPSRHYDRLLSFFTLSSLHNVSSIAASLSAAPATLLLLACAAAAQCCCAVAAVAHYCCAVAAAAQWVLLCSGCYCAVAVAAQWLLLRTGCCCAVVAATQWLLLRNGRGARLNLLRWQSTANDENSNGRRAAINQAAANA